MQDVSSNPALERRRSQRLTESVPVVVRGIDPLVLNTLAVQDLDV